RSRGNVTTARSPMCTRPTLVEGCSVGCWTAHPARIPSSTPMPLRLAIVLVTLVASCTRDDVHDRLTIAIESVPETLDRRMALSQNAMRVAQLVTPGLTRIDEDGRAVPDLALAFEAVDDRTWIFKLRPGIFFSDGSPLRARDVRATFHSVL